MYLVLRRENLNLNAIVLQEPVKNIIRPESYFCKIIYSDTYFILNGIYVLLPFVNVQINRNSNKQLRMSIDHSLNASVHQNITDIEQSIFNMYPINNFSIQQSLANDISHHKSIRVNHDYKHDLNCGMYENFNCVLRVYGLWINYTNLQCGINYQIIPIN